MLQIYKHLEANLQKLSYTDFQIKVPCLIIPLVLYSFCDILDKVAKKNSSGNSANFNHSANVFASSLFSRNLHVSLLIIDSLLP